MFFFSIQLVPLLQFSNTTEIVSLPQYKAHSSISKTNKIQKYYILILILRYFDTCTRTAVFPLAKTFFPVTTISKFPSYKQTYSGQTDGQTDTPCLFVRLFRTLCTDISDSMSVCHPRGLQLKYIGFIYQESGVKSQHLLVLSMKYRTTCYQQKPHINISMEFLSSNKPLMTLMVCSLQISDEMKTFQSLVIDDQQWDCAIHLDRLHGMNQKITR